MASWWVNSRWAPRPARWDQPWTLGQLTWLGHCLGQEARAGFQEAGDEPHNEAVSFFSAPADTSSVVFT